MTRVFPSRSGALAAAAAALLLPDIRCSEAPQEPVRKDDSCFIRMDLILTEEAPDVTKARVVFNSTPGARDLKVQGWSYAICSSAIQFLGAAAGEDLAPACAPAGACKITPVQGGITVSVTLAQGADEGLPEDSFADWEDLVVTFRCPRISCKDSWLSICQTPTTDTGAPSAFTVRGFPFKPAPASRLFLPLCGISEKIRVDPIVKGNGDVAISFVSAPDAPGCILSGWSYGVCLTGDIAFKDVRAGADTLTAKGGAAPDFQVLDYLPGQGIVRAVIIDFMHPTGVSMDAFADGWEDVVMSLEGYPCGRLEICDEKIGEPPVDALWNDPEETSLPMLPGRAGSLDLCFKRADTNFDGRVNVADAINVLACLFPGAAGVYCDCVNPGMHCRPVFNVNDDDRVNIADPIYLLTYLFRFGPEIPPLD